MFKKSIFILSILLLLAACGGSDNGAGDGDNADSSISFSTANIKNATLANDEAGANATTSFAPEDTFYLLVDLANAPDDTTVKAVWTAVSA
ncbi:MAG TPA: hypothetical protein ENK32_09840, partial [Anaerolineae bacterium]|nr:hypothetical protein [Anaerolineae bacterium]